MGTGAPLAVSVPPDPIANDTALMPWLEPPAATSSSPALTAKVEMLLTLTWLPRVPR